MERLERDGALATGATAPSDDRLWMICKGGQQGCPGATYFRWGIYHESLHRTQKEVPEMRIACNADALFLSFSL